MISKDSVLWKGHGETPDKESFSRVAKFYKIDSDTISTPYLGEHSEVSQAWSLQAKTLKIFNVYSSLFTQVFTVFQ